MFIQDGKAAQIGDPDDIADAYSNSFVGTSRSENEHPEGAKESEIRIKQVRVLVDGAEQKYIEKYEDFDIEVTFTTSKAVESSALRLDVVDGRGWLAFSLPERGGRAKVLQPGNHRIVYSVQNTLAFGDFHIDVAFDNGTKRFIIAPGAYQFHMRGYAVAAMPLTIPHTSVVVDGS
jgi:ABC-2 type transport system ATP-binding protein